MCQIGTVNTVENKTKFLLSIRVHLQHEIILNTVDHRTVTIPMATETFKTANREWWPNNSMYTIISNLDKLQRFGLITQRKHSFLISSLSFPCIHQASCTHSH